jgi:UDP-N-acetylmuramate dehydrogenase
VQIIEHVDLQPCNTLALPAHARYYTRIEKLADVHAAIAWANIKKLPLLPLGSGSNIVLRGEWPGLVMQIDLVGKRIERHADHAEVTIAAGENWHALVQWTLQQRAYGLENLTLIPGTVGAAPIQNIGAYGVELSHFLHAVRGVLISENRVVELSAAQCELDYRDSIFKHALKDNFIVTEIVLHLRNRFVAVADYPALREQLGDTDYFDAKQIERAVRAIRQSKLPDPAQWPNAGSFFKNPVISVAQFEQLRSNDADLPHYAARAGVKIPAAWLVDRCGWKGRRLGTVGVHTQQALVLIHYGGGDAAALLALAEMIQTDVHTRFGIVLEIEPTVYGL